MGVENLLATHKDAIVKNWFDHVVNTYPPDTARFLLNKRDPFDNPVGAATMRGLGAIIDELVGSPDPDELAKHLDSIIRIRAIQSFTPSQAVGFVFFLKGIIRETLAGSPEASGGINDLPAMDAKIDQLSLIAFDIYMQCREKIYELRANESRNRFFKSFERAGLITETPDDNPGLG